MAYVMINCESGKEDQMMRDLEEIPEIKESWHTFGSYDIITKIEAISVESLREIITLKIRKMQAIRSTTTIICRDGILSMLKH